MKNIRFLRDKYEFSQNDISNYLNISRGSYSKIELDIREITIQEALKLSILYEESIFFILDLDINIEKEKLMERLIINKDSYKKLRKKIENDNMINKKIDNLLKYNKTNMF